MVACDFFVVVTARFHILYVVVLLELGRRRILHCNVTDHPSAEWTLQQLREPTRVRASVLPCTPVSRAFSKHQKLPWPRRRTSGRHPRRSCWGTRAGRPHRSISRAS